MTVRPWLLMLLFVLAGCAPSATTPAAPPTPVAASPDTVRMAPAIHWTRSSAEHRALFLQVYRQAERQLERSSANHADGSWAVILDADETLVDNSEYQKRRFEAGLPFTIESWNAWVREQRATALPGAAEFTRRVGALGGRVVVVTNRDYEVCPETRNNMTAVGIVHDLVLCMQPGVTDKNPRFRAVANGTASADLPVLQVLMWVGDNIRDFPGATQVLRDAAPGELAAFGERWIILPNPMYGSWERSPVR